MLVTLLLSNCFINIYIKINDDCFFLAIAMEALPIFLDEITSPIIAIIISVTAVLIFGELIYEFKYIF